MEIYAVMAVIWLGVVMLVVWFIKGPEKRKEIPIRAGFITMLVTYICGLSLLGGIIVSLSFREVKNKPVVPILHTHRKVVLG